MTPHGSSTPRAGSHIILRRCILHTLYELFRENPDFPVDIKLVEETCHVPPKELNWNLAYLEKAGYITLSRDYGSAPYIASVVFITIEGIDIVENEDAFKVRFPAPPEL